MRREASCKRQRCWTVNGAQARRLSDTADPDASRFVLPGGQDGWIGSTPFADQATPFLAGRTITVPLTPDAVATAFTTVMRVAPRER